ncbi:MAG: Histidine kinase protein, partial [Patescibacteria group bacterium]|nr:Histidine kinase protein [Patescibacteria group bacterium]
MEYNLITNLQSCYVEIPSLLYYSHIPPAIVVLFFGFFVFWKTKNQKSHESGRALFLISLIFSAWVVTEGIIWFLYDSTLIMFLWAFLGLLYAMLHILSIYFVYVTLDGSRPSPHVTNFLLLMLFPLLFLTPTAFNLVAFDDINCQVIEGQYFLGYRYLIGAISIFWVFILIVSRYRVAMTAELKKKVGGLGFGVLAFLLLFSWSEFIGSLTQNFEVTQYGLFGMPVFLGFLVYLIVRYQAFDIKLLGVQALTITQFILISSMLFFARSEVNRLLTLITLLITTGAGWFLVKSVKKEVERKEELQMMSDRLATANQELKRLDNAKSEFISIASHQLRTPLTAIKGYTSLILEGSYGKIDNQIQDVVNKVYAANSRLIELVENLLSISRLESGRMQYDYRLVQ